MVLEGVPGDSGGLDVDALAARLAQGLKVKFVYLVPTHGNPSGATLSDARRRALVRLAVEHGFTVIADEVYVEEDAAAAAAATTAAGLRYCCARHDCTPAYALPLLLHYCYYYATTTN